jgi:pyruvate kinase
MSVPPRVLFFIVFLPLFRFAAAPDGDMLVVYMEGRSERNGEALHGYGDISVEVELKRAKIVCTIGPASREAATLERLAEAGMNVARINFSHGSHEEHAEVYRRVRDIGGRIAVMQDLQGPKIRVGEIQGEMELVRDSIVVLTAEDPAGRTDAVPVDYPMLAEEVRQGNDIFLADGIIHLLVEEVDGRDVRCRVVHGGLLTSRKGVNLPGSSISAPALTKRDRSDLEFGMALGVDYIALSFVRSPDEVRELRGILDSAGSKAKIVAKIEKREAIDNLPGILMETDAVMIARGDLGVEIPVENVPVVQKELIGRCLAAGKPVITATQMLESMTSSELPTRAEASDVANAVIDGSDALMLSAETATGKFPVETVAMMSRIIEAAEEYAGADAGGYAPGPLLNPAETVDTDTDAVASGTVEIAREVGARAIVVLTHSGRTASLVARRRPHMPIVALTDLENVSRQLSLVWGIETIMIDEIEKTEEIIGVIRGKMIEAGYTGRIVLTAGIPTGDRAPTNTVHVVDL